MLVLSGALVLLAALLLSPGLALGPSLDAAVFAGIADQLLGGAGLYVDAWDHKPPAAYVMFAAGQAALPWLSPWLVSWVISVLATAGTGLGVAYALAALGVQKWSSYLAAAAVVAFMAQYLTALGGGLTEPLAALPAAWALALALRESPTARRLVGIGVLLGLALLTSFQLVPALFSIAGLGLAFANPSRRWRALEALAFGAAIPLLVAGAALQATGTLGAAVDAVFGYGAAYRTASAAYGAELSRAPAAWTFLSALFLVTTAALGGLALRRARSRSRWVLFAMLAWIAIAIVLFVYQGRFIAHYAIPLAIPLGVLAGLGLDLTAARWARANSAARTALAFPLLLALVASAVAGFIAAGYELTANEQHSRQVAAAAQYVEEHSRSNERILVWGNRAELYLAADRPPAMRYRFMYPLTTEGYVTRDLVEQVMSDLSEHPPLLVVDAGSIKPGAPGFLPLLIERPVVREGREVDLLEPLREFIRANYDLVAEAAGWPIYRLRATNITGNE